LAYARDGGHDPRGYVGMLRGLRALGAGIRRGNGTARIVPPTDMDAEDLAAVLGTRRPVVAAMLAEVSGAS